MPRPGESQHTAEARQRHLRKCEKTAPFTLGRGVGGWRREWPGAGTAAGGESEGMRQDLERRYRRANPIWCVPGAQIEPFHAPRLCRIGHCLSQPLRPYIEGAGSPAYGNKLPSQ